MSITDVFSTDSVLNVDDGIPVLVGAGIDCVSFYVGADGGMKAKLQASLLWLFLVMVLCPQIGTSVQRCIH